MFNGLTPSHIYTMHQGQSGGRGLSPRLWGKLYGNSSSPDGLTNGYMCGSDFLNFGGLVTTNVGDYSDEGARYVSYEDTGGSIAQVATKVGGVITMTTDADDNQENWLMPGGAASVFGKISDTAGDDKLLIFETRFQVSALVGNFFLGLSEEGLAAADTITDAGALASKDLVGFFALEDAPTTLKFGYRKAGQTAQTVFSYGTALVADTWYKVGFVYDPDAPTAKRIAAFIDNEEQSTYVTGTNIAAATFPDAEELHFLAGHKNVTDITTLSLDWWNLYQSA